jgi:catechol 2,3-dioxygenase-like lactoylglutathione lyase family enzyme
VTVNLHHVAITVTDIDASIAWYKDVFGFEELMRDEHFQGAGGYAVVVGKPDFSMAIVLNHHPTVEGELFDPTRTGLDHVGFTVADRDELVEWEGRFSNKGVKHSGITDHDFGSALNFRDPDDLQLQLVAFAPSG